MAIDERYTGTFLVIGPPGCGKTTFLSRQVQAIVGYYQENDLRRELAPNPVLICSLTRAAAAEVAGRDLPIHESCVGTLHAHAYRALDRPKLTVDSPEIVEWNNNFPAYAMSISKKKMDPDDPAWATEGESNSRRHGDVLAERYELLRNRRVKSDHWPADVEMFAKKWNEWKRENELADFTDLIELCLENVDGPPMGPRVLLVDEAQDCSALEYELIKKWGRYAGCLMIVGDPRQSLYEWRGAHPDLFNDPEIDDNHRRVLSQSYRVPESVVRLSQEWAEYLSDYKDISYKPRMNGDETSAVGVVERERMTWKSPAALIQRAEGHSRKGRSVMICASCAYMVAPVVKAMRQYGTPFANPWRTRRGDWNPLGKRSGLTTPARLVAFLSASNYLLKERAQRWTWRQIGAWTGMLTSAAIVKHGQGKRLKELVAEHKDHVAEISEIGEVLDISVYIWLLELISDGTIGDQPVDDPIGKALAWFNRNMKSQYRKTAEYPLRVLRRFGIAGLLDPPRIYVGTIHSFKGAEADVVYLFPDVSPSGFSAWSRGDRGRDSVVRTFYVGMTRARETLVLCSPSADSPSVPLWSLGD